MGKLPTLLLLLSATCARAGVTAPAESPLLRVTHGRATVAHAGGVERMQVSSPAANLGGGGHVETSVRDHVELRWARSMSLRVEGYSSFSVNPSEGAAPRRYVDFLYFGTADIEVRRGEITLGLPQNWLLNVGRGAIHIKERVDGTLELMNRGGLSVGLRDLDEPSRGLPKQLSPGQVLILPLSRKP